MMAPSQSTSRPESVDVGSSSRRMRGSRRIARAISIFCLTGEIEAAHLVVERDIGHVERGEMLVDELAGAAAADRPDGPTGP